MAVQAVLNAFLACMFTYTLTAAGAAGVYVFDTYGNTSKTAAVMATAVGLMLSAVMDLLQECLEVSEAALGLYAWAPVAVGVVVASVVLVGLDNAFASPEEASSAPPARVVSPGRSRAVGAPSDTDSVENGDCDTTGLVTTRRRSHGAGDGGNTLVRRDSAFSDGGVGPSAAETRKAWLLFFALTVQHIPEALAMGVAFEDAEATGHWGTAISVTLAIGLQDIPEGLAAALVLRQLGMSKRKSFMFGQATGMVQPISGVLGALAVMVVRAALPYALAFAGACMLFVVVRDMLPDCMKGEDRTLPTLMVMVGFAVMMIATVLINSLTV